MGNAIYPVLPGLSFDVGWSPAFKTKVLTATSGKEYRAALMANPVYSLKMKYEFLRAGARNELRTLAGFFLARRGSFDSFLFEHPDDNAVADQLIGVANGVTTTFQLLRGYGSEFVEPVQNPKQVTAIKVNGVIKTLGTHYTMSSTGMVVFTSAPLVGNITWSGSYYYRARFAQDVSDFNKFMKDLWDNKKVELLACLGTKI